MASHDDKPLWGTAEVVERYGIGRTTFYRWRNDYGFPEPICELRMGPVFSPDLVRAWYRKHVAR